MTMLQGRLVMFAVLAITCFNSAQRAFADEHNEENGNSADAEGGDETSADEKGANDSSSSEDASAEGSTSSSNDTTSALITEGDSEDAETTTVIVLAVLLAVLLLCNMAVFYIMCKKSKKNKSPTPPPPNGSGASVQPPLPPSDVARDLEMTRTDLDAERKRRIHAEALIQRATPGGIRVSDFPSVAEVNQHIDRLAKVVLEWTSKACAIAGPDPALPMTMQAILMETFVVCSDEVKRCMANKVNSLSDFLGSNEPVSLAGGTMNLDTSYVLYECLTRNYESIVSVEPDHTGSLATEILQRCASCADARLAKQMMAGDAWLLFEAVMQNYIRIFVECALQNGPMLFNDDVGKETTFDPVIHRDWAPHLSTSRGQQCCIVFPGLTRQEGRPASTAKMGIVHINT